MIGYGLIRYIVTYGHDTFDTIDTIDTTDTPIYGNMSDSRGDF